MPRVYTSVPVEDRFWGKFDRRGDDECWEWLGAHTTPGYGQLRSGTGRVYAHRVSYEIANGPIPSGLVIDHICRNPRCVNPAHLRACTQSQNVMNSSIYANNKSGVRGVYFEKSRPQKPWYASIAVGGKSIGLGNFKTIEEASRAYSRASEEFHGEYAGPTHG